MTSDLGSLTVWSADGTEQPLSSLWADRVAVVVFVRHFGCIFCRQQVAELAPFAARFADAGADLMVMGQGTVAQARAFRDEHGLRCPVFTDPSRQVFGALGMRRGIGTLLRPSVAFRAATARVRGFRQTGATGDVLQQGGVVVVAPGGRQLFRFLSRSAGEHPDPLDILTAIERGPFRS